jgi:hypothetical protein
MKHNEFVVFVFGVLIIATIAVGLYDNDYKKAMVTGTDFESSDQGTIMFWTDAKIKKEKTDVDYLMFFASKSVRGLKIVYDFRDFRLKAGMPLISSEKEIRFDGDEHLVAYTFENKGRQILYFDGAPVAKGPFVMQEKVPLTGFTVYDNKELLDASYEADDVIVYGKALSEEEIKEFLSR